MRFVVSTSALLNKLTLVNGVIGSNTVLPILEYFLFDIRDSTMTITATDLETSMKTDLDVDAKEDGRISIPARMLLDTLKTLPEQPLTFSFDESTSPLRSVRRRGSTSWPVTIPTSIRRSPSRRTARRWNCRRTSCSRPSTTPSSR